MSAFLLAFYLVGGFLFVGRMTRPNAPIRMGTPDILLAGFLWPLFLLSSIAIAIGHAWRGKTS